ncbi:MAG: hypothetical protein RSH52_35760, partial [Janthinobacterium sp.]
MLLTSGYHRFDVPPDQGMPPRHDTDATGECLAMPPAGRTLTCSIALGACYVLAQLALTAWAGAH